MLGVSDLVENVLAEADEAMERKYALAAQGILGLTITHLGATLGISVPTVSVAAKRGERIAFENKYSLIELLNINI